MTELCEVVITAPDPEWLFRLTRALVADGLWYVDFRSDTEVFVAFAGRVFRYARGDQVGRAEAQAHGRSAGVPNSQLDWPA